MYAFGPVIEWGLDLKKGKNHAEYIDDNGWYDIVKYLTDFKNDYPTLYAVGVGQLAPHVTSEVDCESLFSQVGFLSDPRRAKAAIRMYERLVIGKHRLHRIYCSIPKEIELYQERARKNDRGEKEERDDLAFLKLEKEIWTEMFPETAKHYLAEEEEENDEDNKTDGEEKNNEKSKRKSRDTSDDEDDVDEDHAAVLCGDSVRECLSLSSDNSISDDSSTSEDD